MVEFIVKAAIAAIIIGGLTLIRKLISRASKPASVGQDSGTIRYNLIMMGGPALFCGVLLCALLGYVVMHADGLRDSDRNGLLGICGFLALFTYVFCAALMSDSAIHWSKDGVSGPSTYGMWPFGPKRATIHWHDIKEVGIGAYEHTFIMNTAGTKIRWSHQYSGHDAFSNAVQTARPDLFQDP